MVESMKNIIIIKLSMLFLYLRYALVLSAEWWAGLGCVVCRKGVPIGHSAVEFEETQGLVPCTSASQAVLLR